MKICPSCERTYSDTLTQCPVCGIDLSACASGSTDTECSQTHSDVETHTQKTADTKEEKKNGWKAAFLVLLVLMLAFVGNFAIQVSEYKDLESSYNWKKREYNSLKKENEALQKEKDSLSAECKKLENTISLYDLQGKYRIQVTDVYNGTEDYEKKSSKLDHKNLDGICFKWTVYDDTKTWGDTLYVDIITPAGKVFDANAKKDNHTFKIDLSGTSGDTHGRQAWFQESTWSSGTYRVIFYQGSRAIDSYDIKVS